MKNTEALMPASDVRGGAGRGNYSPGLFKEKALEFLKERLDEGIFNRIMKSGDARRHPYVAARIYLGKSDWEKFIYIEKYGSLEGYPEDAASV